MRGGGRGEGKPAMRLNRARRIQRSRDFSRVRVEGRSYPGRYLVLGVLGDEGLEGGIRYGFVTSKRVGGAVVRNRVRRRLRGIVTEVGDGLCGGHWVVTVARYRAGEASYQELKEDWLRLVARARLKLGSGEAGGLERGGEGR
jgi:ribonuclease P protein component